MRRLRAGFFLSGFYREVVMAHPASIWPTKVCHCQPVCSERKPSNKKQERERPRGAMHCEWSVQGNLVSRGAPVTGPSTRSPVFLATAVCADDGGPSLAGHHPFLSCRAERAWMAAARRSQAEPPSIRHPEISRRCVMDRSRRTPSSQLAPIRFDRPPVRRQPAHLASGQNPGVSIGPDDCPVMNCWTIGSGDARSSAGVASACTTPW